MNGGIDQLVDTYKGNPQPLAQKVQQAQQGQPPGAIPSDLEAALALQEITQLRQGAQNQQAMQAGGAQPTVVEKLQQLLGGMQQQAQMPQMPQGQPVMAARGGSIDQLMSNLGRHYAGGGIVAFDGTTGSKVEDPTKESSSQFAQDIASLPQKFDELKQRAREEDAIRAEQDRRMAQYKQDKLAAQQKTSLFNYLFGSPEREKAGVAKLAELSNAPLTTPAATKETTVDPEVEKLRRLAAARAQTGQSANPALVPKPPTPAAPAAPRPAVNAGIGDGPAKPTAEAPAKPDPNSLRALSEQYIRAEMGLNPETESDKAVTRARKLMGLEALLKEKEGRASAKEKYIDEMKAKRAPLWIDALMSAGKPARGGIASVLQNMAVGASAARQNYEAEDLKYIDELNRLRDVITDAKITGNKELAKEALAAFKETDARRKAALTSATSLLNTDENAAARIQQANIAAQARRDAAAGRGTGSGDKQQLNELKALQTSMKDQLKDPRMMGKAGDELRRQLAAVNAEIAKMAGLSTMAAAPGAASPGGTRPPLSSFQR